MSQPEQFEVLISWQRTGWQATGLAYGAIGASDCRRRAPVDRGLLPQYCLSTQQE